MGQSALGRSARSACRRPAGIRCDTRAGLLFHGTVRSRAGPTPSPATLKFLRSLLPAALGAAVLAVLFAAVLFSPITQAWALEYWLSREPGATASVGSVFAGVHEVEVRDLKLRRPGLALTLPAADLTVSWLPALLGQPLRISRITARGWNLEVGEEPPPAVPGAVRPASAPVAPPRPTPAPRLTGWSFPTAAAGAQLNLDGALLLRGNSGTPDRRVTLTLKGSNAADASPLTYEIDARVPVALDWLQAATLRGTGRLSLGTDPSRHVKELAFTGAVLAGDTRLPADPEVHVRVTASPDGAEHHDLELRRSRRPVASLTSRPDPAVPGTGGTWALDLHPEDLATLRTPWVAFLSGLQGQGHWTPGRPDSAGAWSGRLTATTPGRDATKLTWGPAGPAKATADFTLRLRDGLLDIEHLDTAIGTPGTLARVQALQAFRVSPEADRLELGDPQAPWLHVLLDALPLDWLPAPADGPGLGRGVISGPVTASLPDGRLALRADTPLQARGVELRWNGQALVLARDLTLALRAEKGPGGWSWHADPLTLTVEGRTTATVHADVTPLYGSGLRWSVAGRGEGLLESLFPAPSPRTAGFLRGTSLSATFQIQTGTATDADLKLAFTQPATGRGLNAQLQARIDAQGRASWQGPATFTFASAATELSLHGSWDRARRDHALELELDGAKVDLAAVTADLPAWLAAFGPDADDREPCWGAFSGRIRFSCHELLALGRTWNAATATLLTSPTELRLEGARGRLVPPAVEPPTSAARNRRPPALRPEPVSTVFGASGRARFTPGQTEPYQWEATLDADVLELKPAEEVGATPPTWSVEGRFAASARAHGAGRNLEELLEVRGTEVSLRSRNGLFRFLRANVGAALPAPKETAVTDALATAGLAVGAVLGLQRDSVYSGVRQLPKATEAILTFGSLIGERRYDDLSLVARREGSGPFVLSAIDLAAPQIRLRGTGRSAWQEGRPLAEQPLELDLTLGFQGTLADLLRTGGVITGPADASGHSWLPEPVRFGGTLGAIDAQAWTAVLAEPAARAIEAAAKAKR
jgi:hypothetical protein